MAKFRFPSWLVAGGALVGAWAIYTALLTDHDMPIGPAVDATRDEFHGKNSTLLSYYADTTNEGKPLVLIHSINAAANAYEVRPIFNHYRSQRPVYALDLPGFGFSERTNREYSTELYVSAIKDFLEDVVQESADVVALSLSSEFASIAAQESPELFHSLTLVSPTGFTPRQNKATSQSARENEQSNGIYNFLTNPIWSQAIYDILVSKPSMRWFLSMNFAGEVDEGLLDYHYRSTHQPNARYAPYHFVSGTLFSPDILHQTYKELTIPTMVVYDTDPNVSFDLLPELLSTNANWRARRILNTRGMPHFERPDMTFEALDVFWDDIS